MDSQIIGACALMVLAWLGFSYDMVLPDWVPIYTAAVIGSLQALFVRKKRGFVKGRGHIVWALFAGITGGVIFGSGFSAILGVNVESGAILFNYIFGLMGARIVLWLSTGLDIPKAGNAILDRLLKRPNE